MSVSNFLHQLRREDGQEERESKKNALLQTVNYMHIG